MFRFPQPSSIVARPVSAQRADPVPAAGPCPPQLHVALLHPEIHWNTGNAGRTCLAAGARLHLVHPLGFSLDEREVRRAGLDYWPRVDPAVWPDWGSFEERLPEFGEPFFVSPEARREFWSVCYPSPAVLVFGRESVGLPPEIRQRYHHRLVSIPMVDPELRSLNLSTSVAIVAFEVLRQWRSQGRERKPDQEAPEVKAR